MNKVEFIFGLYEKLGGVPHEEIDDRVSFYLEMIDDRVEEGLSEEDAVSAIGSVDEIAEQIVADIPMSRLVKEKIRPKKKLKAWEVILLALGSPVWLPLLMAAFAVVLSLYISLWSIVISLWAVFVSFAECALGGAAACIVFLLSGNVRPGIAVLGAGIVCAGLAILMFYVCRAVTRGTVLLAKKCAGEIKKCFIKRGRNNE